MTYTKVEPPHLGPEGRSDMDEPRHIDDIERVSSLIKGQVVSMDLGICVIRQSWEHDDLGICGVPHYDRARNDPSCC